MTKSVLICEKQSPVTGSYDLICVWDSFEAPEKAISVPALVEQDAEHLKTHYLSWIYELGLAQSNGRSVIQTLMMRPGFSAWWLSLMAEKSQWKSRQMYSVLRLMALDRFLGQHKIRNLTVNLKNSQVLQCLQHWAGHNQIPIQMVNSRFNQNKKGRDAFLLLPYPLQAAGALVRFFIKRWRLAGSRIRRNRKTPRAGVCFIAPFFNCRPDDQGRFYSNYWTRLHHVLAESKQDTLIQWLHLYIDPNNTMRAGQALEKLKGFNRSAPDNHAHLFFESELGGRTLLKALADYFRLCIAGLTIKRPEAFFSIGRSGLNVWPLMRHDWQDSLTGRTAMTNCLFFNLFEQLLEKMPVQKKGWYLLENQAWEKALIYCWKKAGHGTLHGVQHTIAKYWDLRHGADPRTFTDSRCQYPMPDVLMLNGQKTVDAYLNTGFPKGRIRKAEALRFLYLEKLKTQAQPQTRRTVPVLLVLGDIQPAVTARMLDMAAGCQHQLAGKADIRIKFHPACFLDMKPWPGLENAILAGSLGELADQYDIAFTSNGTTSGLDAFLSGKTVITLLEPGRFNMSPLRSCPQVRFVADAGQLCQAVLGGRAEGPRNPEQYFFLHKDLPKWKSILEMERTAGV